MRHEQWLTYQDTGRFVFLLIRLVTLFVFWGNLIAKASLSCRVTFFEISQKILIELIFILYKEN